MKDTDISSRLPWERHKEAPRKNKVQAGRKNHLRYTNHEVIFPLAIFLVLSSRARLEKMACPFRASPPECLKSPPRCPEHHTFTRCIRNIRSVLHIHILLVVLLLPQPAKREDPVLYVSNVNKLLQPLSWPQASTEALASTSYVCAGLQDTGAGGRGGGGGIASSGRPMTSFFKVPREGRH